MCCIITLDVGTTSVKTCIFDQRFNLLGFSTEEYELSTPANDIVELNPEMYWRASKNGIEKVISISGVKPEDIRVISITTQGETLIPVDKNGKALRNAIVWLDTRAAEEAEFICKLFSVDEIYSTTGLPEIGAACPVSKVLWMKNKEPGIYHNTYKFLLLEDFLIMKLTGKFVTEKSLMSSTGYFDINQGLLFNKILDELNIDKDKFPEIMECGKVAGDILLDVADELNISPAAIVATCAMDQIASAIGAGNVTSGMVTETTGTALVIAATTDAPDYTDPARITIYRHAVKDKFVILPYSPTAGIILKWFKDEFLRYESEIAEKSGEKIYSVMDEMAECIPPLSGGLTLLPYFAGMMAPEANSKARGIFFGVGLDTKKGHFIRAIIESVAYMLRENIELLEKMGLKVEKVCSLGGGSKSRLWSDIKACVTGKEILTMEQEETTSLGAAILGSISAGMYDDVEEACKVVKVKESYKPDPKTYCAYNNGYETYKKLCQMAKQYT